MKWLRAAAAAAATVAAVIWACGSPHSIDVSPVDAGLPPDGGPGDAGPGDGGPGDGGPTDGGPTDGGPIDGGYVPPPAIPFPSVPGWSFLGPQNNGPHDVFQVSADQGGNGFVFLVHRRLRCLERTGSRAVEREGVHLHSVKGQHALRMLSTCGDSP